MDPSQIDVLVQRLVANPHDEEALTAAHQSGAADPKSYALLLERVGAQTRDPAYAAHWMSEAANVWSTTLGDAHRAARVLMQAIERDPTQASAADRLAQLYRDKGDSKALVALLERRAKALAPLVGQNDEVRVELTGIHEELGRLWAETLQQPKKALDNYRRALELTPSSAYAMYGSREIYKSLGQWKDALATYEPELEIERDPARRVALFRDEAETRRSAGDLPGATRALGRALEAAPADATVQQEFSATVVERVAGGDLVSAQDRSTAVQLLVGLAEAYDGEHGLAYSAGALDIEPGHDRALQLHAHYARTLEREEDVPARYLAYLQANPQGSVAPDARWLLEKSYEAAGQLEDAIQILEPLIAQADAKAKLAELYEKVGRKMPSTPPPVGAQGPSDKVVAAPVAAPDAAARPAPRSALSMEPARALGVKAAGEDKSQTQSKYAALLARDPAHPEALAWTLDHLRAARDYKSLRDVLLAAARVSISTEVRKERLREVAELSDVQLSDVDGAISAYKQIVVLDPEDEAARAALVRGFEKSSRWDELASLLEQAAGTEVDLEKKIALEKRVAIVHEQKRADLLSAARTWERVVALVPDDDQAISQASTLFEKAAAVEDAARVIADHVAGVDDSGARAVLLERLGHLRERLGDSARAGEAFAEAADIRKDVGVSERAERCFAAAQSWAPAGRASVTIAELETNPAKQARHLGRAAEHFERAGDDAAVVEHLEHATDLDPGNDDFAKRLSSRYAASARHAELAAFWVRRADRLAVREKRVEARRLAAEVYATHLADKDLAREMWRKVLEDGDDSQALEWLVDDAIVREDPAEASGLLRRLEAVVPDAADKARVALREAEVVADGLGEVDAAIDRYERILSQIDPGCRHALQAIADLQEARDNASGAADALERELKLATQPDQRGPIANRLARLYEQLGDLPSAIRSLDVVVASDPDDFDVLPHLCDLCERTQDWAKVAELLAQRIEIEADDGELSLLTKKLSSVLADKLDRGDEALAALDEISGQGDASVRAAYVELGDRLGWRGIVATKLVEWWFEEKPGPERTTNLRGAFERFADVGREADAIRVACEIARSKGADAELARRLEHFAAKAGDLDSLATAHELMARDVTGLERAEELVRQAEVRLKAGAPGLEALRLGEEGLTSAPSEKTEPLLARLALIAGDPKEVVDLYERQISRHRTMPERLAALARAAQVAAEHGQIDRARNLFDLALGAAPVDEVVPILERAARETDGRTGGDELRRVLCAALAGGGQGARDSGHTRAVLLRRAAALVYGDLKDAEQAFAWLGEALVAHVDAPTLDALDALARDVREPRRAEATLSHALAEVFEGPLLRQLLARRAKLRREELDDRLGAATDLKKLYDLSPSDPAVLEELSALLTELGDHRAMVQLYEDQILRGKEVTSRAELARKVAQLWERELGDPREAADAWRRVLRMKPGDPEATAGLEGAKANMLRRPSALMESDEATAAPVTHEPAGERQHDLSLVEGAATAPANAVASEGAASNQKDIEASAPRVEVPDSPAMPAVTSEVGDRVQAQEPDGKRSTGRRRRRSGRPETAEVAPTPATGESAAAAEAPSPATSEAPAFTEAPTPAASESATAPEAPNLAVAAVAAPPPDMPSSPATLVDPKGPPDEALFAPSEPRIAVAAAPDAPRETANAGNSIDVDVSMVEDDGAADEIAVEEVAEVLESMDAPPLEPARPRRSIPPPLPPASVRPRQEK
jgi:tetratricopeptide (TPR) repeat protein